MVSCNCLLIFYSAGERNYYQIYGRYVGKTEDRWWREREIENERERFKEKVNVGKNSKVLVMKLKSISKESAQNFKYGIDNVAN